jgi:pimeloyl-ACP methyl ester carboxylesterase
MGIDVSTLVVWGTEDRIIPTGHASTAHQVIPNSRVVLFKGAGRFTHLDQPERFAQLLSDFIRP